MPDRPNAALIARCPAITQPCERRCGRVRTWIAERWIAERWTAEKELLRIALRFRRIIAIALSRAQSLQFKPSVTLTFCPHIIFSGMVSALADHALVLLIVSLRAQWRAKAAGGLRINAEYAQDSHCR
jgi:hypothetical protein